MCLWTNQTWILILLWLLIMVLAWKSYTQNQGILINPCPESFIAPKGTKINHNSVIFLKISDHTSFLRAQMIPEATGNRAEKFFEHLLFLCRFPGKGVWPPPKTVQIIFLSGHLSSKCPSWILTAFFSWQYGFTLQLPSTQ